MRDGSKQMFKTALAKDEIFRKYWFLKEYIYVFQFIVVFSYSSQSHILDNVFRVLIFWPY